MDWFLYDNGRRYERVNSFLQNFRSVFDHFGTLCINGIISGETNTFEK